LRVVALSVLHPAALQVKIEWDDAVVSAYSNFSVANSS